MQSKTILGLAAAMFSASPALAQANRYTLTTVYDATAHGEWLPAAPVLGESGRCFFSLGSSTGPARIVMADGAGLTDLGALPWPGVHASSVRQLDASHDQAIFVTGNDDAMNIDAALLFWNGGQLVEVTRVSDHFDSYGGITGASVEMLSGIAYAVRGIESKTFTFGSKLVFVNILGVETTVWDSRTSDPFALGSIDSMQMLTCGDIVVTGTRHIPGNPSFGEVVVGLFDLESNFTFQLLAVNSFTNTDVMLGWKSWSASEAGGFVHLGGSSGTERTLVQRGLTSNSTAILHRALCPEPWIGFTTVAVDDVGRIAFTGVARDCATQFHYGEALQVGGDPIADRVLGVGDAYAGSTVTAVELAPSGRNGGGEIALLVRLANMRTLVVRADPTPEIFAVCPGDGTQAACPCGNSGGAGRGCANSVSPEGALLSGTGIARVSNDTFTLTASAMPNSLALLFQGTDDEFPGVPFGDGIRCVSGTVLRLGQRVVNGGTATFPGPGEPSLSVRGAIPESADTSRLYQCYYRNAASFCTSATFNVTNSISVTWGR